MLFGEYETFCYFTSDDDTDYDDLELENIFDFETFDDEDD